MMKVTGIWSSNLVAPQLKNIELQPWKEDADIECQPKSIPLAVKELNG